MLGRGMAQFDRTLSQDDPSRRSVGQIIALSRHLSRQPEQMGGTGTGDLYLGSCLPRQSACDIVRVRGKRPEPGMRLGQIIEASCQAAQLAVACKARESLIDSGALGEVQEVARREHASSSAGQGAPHNLVGSRGTRLIHVSENLLCVSDIQQRRILPPEEADGTTAS
jgi:hypothetical protein